MAGFRSRSAWQKLVDNDRLPLLIQTYSDLFMAKSQSIRRAEFPSAKGEGAGVTIFTESIVEEAALAWIEALGYAVLHGPDIAVGESASERSDPNYRDVVLEWRLRQANGPA